MLLLSQVDLIFSFCSGFIFIGLVTLLIQWQSEYTVGARIPNAFRIRMVHSRLVLVPTIQKPNFQNVRSELGRFIYKLSRGKICVANFKAPPASGASLERHVFNGQLPHLYKLGDWKTENDLAQSGHFESAILEW